MARFFVSPEVEKTIESMPAISPIMGKINQISREMETSPRELVKIIMLDPTLTGKVIKLVNSSFYGLAQKVRSLAQAVVYLGVNTVKNLAISTALLSTLMLHEKRKVLDTDTFWLHCLATAVGSRLLAGKLRVGPQEIEMYFVAGLLHDIGKVLLARTNPDKYSRALSDSGRLGIELPFAEAAHFGCTHAQAGGVLARKWKLDAVYVEVIENHHELPRNGADRMHAVVAVINNLCKSSSAGESGNRVIEEMTANICRDYAIQPAYLKAIEAKLPEELKKATTFLRFIQG